VQGSDSQFIFDLRDVVWKYEDKTNSYGSHDYDSWYYSCRLSLPSVLGSKVVVCDIAQYLWFCVGVFVCAAMSLMQFCFYPQINCVVDAMGVSKDFVG